MSQAQNIPSDRDQPSPDVPGRFSPPFPPGTPDSGCPRPGDKCSRSTAPTSPSVTDRQLPAREAGPDPTAVKLREDVAAEWRPQAPSRGPALGLFSRGLGPDSRQRGPLLHPGPEPGAENPRVFLLHRPSRPDRQFLVFFFSRLRKNQSGRYEDAFPFVSLCGRERNFVRCDDLPVVFTHLLEDGPGSARLSYGGGGEALAVPFEPARLMPLPANGRLYHPAPKLAGGVGLVRSSLAFELSSCFQYPPGGATLPTHILWQGQKYPLTMDLASLFPKSCEP